MIVGLTGGTGTGKTSISAIFAKSGFEVIDYDKVTREVYAKGSDCLNEITKVFGKKVLNTDGTLNRRALGEIVFGDKEALELLNKTVYKYILAYTSETIENSDGKKLLLDAPTLFEAGLNDKCDFVVGVIADKETRAERVSKRDNLKKEKVYERINSQKSDDFYRENCDFIIENNSSTDALNEQTTIVLRSIEYEFGKKGTR